MTDRVARPLPISILTLRLSSLAFSAFGIWGLVSPESMLAHVGIHDVPTAASVEFRAYYGGLELGFALFLQICARIESFARPGLWAAASIFWGCAIVRFAGMVLASCYSWPIAMSLFGETAFAFMTSIMGILEFRRQRFEVGSRLRPS